LFLGKISGGAALFTLAHRIFSNHPPMNTQGCCSHKCLRSILGIKATKLGRQPGTFVDIACPLRIYGRRGLVVEELSLWRVGAVGAISAAVFIGSAAEGTALWLLGKAFGLVEFLFSGGKSKRGAAIGTLEGLFLKSHWMISSLTDLVGARVIQYLI
jgi:hypothetical protein